MQSKDIFISNLEDLSDLAVLKGLKLKGASVECLSEEIHLNKKRMMELHQASIFLEEVQMSTIAAYNTAKLQFSRLTSNIERRGLNIPSRIGSIPISDDIDSEELLTESESEEDDINDDNDCDADILTMALPVTNE